MHITDGILSGPMIVTTSALAAGGVAMGLRKLDYQEIPRVGLLASAFFMVSIVNVPVGPVHTHLSLYGLMGMLLGWRSFVAGLAAMLLQAVLFGYGGLTSLGVNVLVMGVSATACYYMFAQGIKQGMAPRRMFIRGFAAGVSGVVLATAIVVAVLLITGKEFRVAVKMFWAWNLLVMIIEGLVTGWAIVLLGKVKLEILTDNRELADV